MTVCFNALIKILQCQGAALDELFDNPSQCFGRYQTAQILLHSLVLHASQQDKELLMKCKFYLKDKATFCQFL